MIDATPIISDIPNGTARNQLKRFIDVKMKVKYKEKLSIDILDVYAHEYFMLTMDTPKGAEKIDMEEFVGIREMMRRSGHFEDRPGFDTWFANEANTQVVMKIFADLENEGIYRGNQ